MSDECIRRAKAREALESGKLPTLPRLDTYRFHPRCFAVWESLRAAEAVAD